MLDNSQEAVRERVRIVAESWLSGNSKTQAYKDAGYASPTPANAATFFDDHREEIEGYVFKALKSKVPLALQVLEEVMMHGKSETARIKAVIELLDRAGFTTINRIEVTQKDVSELENKQIEKELETLLAKSGKLKLIAGGKND